MNSINLAEVIRSSDEIDLNQFLENLGKASLMPGLKLPVVLKDRVLISPGYWNKMKYSKQMIERLFYNTDWDNRRIISILANHITDENINNSGARDWIGYVTNPRLRDGYILGDVNIIDPDTAIKCAAIMAMPKGMNPEKNIFGISASLDGNVNPNNDNELLDGYLKNFSLVFGPAVKTAFINNSDNKLANVSAFEELRINKGMSIDSFYAAPRDPPSSSKLPIFDEEHVRNAIARFNQTDFSSESEKSAAANKIRSAAEKFGIKVSDSSLSIKSGGKYMSETQEPSIKDTNDAITKLSESINGISERLAKIEEKYPPENPQSADETLASIMELAGAGDLFKKAAEIRKEGESMSDAIKRAKEMMTGNTKEQPMPEPEKLAEMEKKINAELSEIKESVKKLGESAQRESEAAPAAEQPDFVADGSDASMAKFIEKMTFGGI